ncbi:DUF190 domain-containing protein [Actinophytocola sp.]|uniref:DUF190 domain-containing protein n=1 Tax=Actinophytocola sp. TaxID=1872138 RepID=UPI0039C8AA62
MARHPRAGSEPALGANASIVVLTGQGDIWHHWSLYAEIVHRARTARLVEATVIREIDRSDSIARIHLQHRFQPGRLPQLIVIIAENRVHGFLPRLDKLEINGFLDAGHDRRHPLFHRTADRTAASTSGQRHRWAQR